MKRGGRRQEAAWAVATNTTCGGQRRVRWASDHFVQAAHALATHPGHPGAARARPRALGPLHGVSVGGRVCTDGAIAGEQAGRR